MTREDAFFCELVESTDDLVTRLDRRGRFFYVSPAAKKFFGMEPEKCIGKSFISFVHEDDRPITLKSFDRWIHNRISTTTHENRQVSINGDVYHMMWTVNLNYYEDGELKDISSIGRDITHMKEVEEELRRSNDMWNELFMASPVWIFLATLEDGYILDCNKAACEDTGYRKSEIIGRTTRQIGLWPDPDDRNRTLPLIKSQGGLVRYPLKLRVRDDELRNYLWSTVIIQHQGEPCLLSVLVDVTDLKQTQEQLNQINRELEKRTQELSEMNAALKVLLKQRDEDKRDLESRVWHNIEEMIQPHLYNLRDSGLNAAQLAHLDIAVGRLNDIASNLGQTLGYTPYGLTGRELEVVGHIIEGMTNKDIANLLNISAHSVESHRFSIRKKLGLLGKRINLRTHLLSLSQKGTVLSR